MKDIYKYIYIYMSLSEMKKQLAMKNFKKIRL
jgi:hypothetical protein